MQPKPINRRKRLLGIGLVLGILVFFFLIGQLSGGGTGELRRPETPGFSLLIPELVTNSPQIITQSSAGGARGLQAVVPDQQQWLMPSGKVLLYTQESRMGQDGKVELPADLEQEYKNLAPIMEKILNGEDISANCSIASELRLEGNQGEADWEKFVQETVDKTRNMTEAGIRDVARLSEGLCDTEKYREFVTESTTTADGDKVTKSSTIDGDLMVEAWGRLQKQIQAITRPGAGMGFNLELGYKNAYKEFHELYYAKKRGCFLARFELLDPTTGQTELLGGGIIHNIREAAILPINEQEVAVVGHEIEDLDCNPGLPSGFEQSRNSLNEATVYKYNLTTNQADKATFKTNTLKGLQVIPKQLITGKPFILPISENEALISVPQVSGNKKGALQYRYNLKANQLTLMKKSLDLPTQARDAVVLTLANGDSIIYNNQLHSLQYFNAKKLALATQHYINVSYPAGHVEMFQMNNNQILVTNPTPVYVASAHSEFDTSLKPRDKIFVWDFSANQLVERSADLDNFGGSSGYRMVSLAGTQALVSGYNYEDLPNLAGTLDIDSWKVTPIKPSKATTQSFEAELSRTDSKNLSQAFSLPLGDWMFISSPPRQIHIDSEFSQSIVTFRNPSSPRKDEINLKKLLELGWELQENER